MRVKKFGIHLLAAGLLYFPVAANGQEDPDIFSVETNSRGDLVSGSLDKAILDANAGSNSANSIVFEPNELNNLSLVLDSELPAIDLQAADPDVSRSVDLTASSTTNFLISVGDDVPEDFVLLHVKSGEANLVDLDISSSEGRYLIDSGATLGLDYESDHTISAPIEGEGRLVKKGDFDLRLAGTNSYSGGTEIKSGKLLGDLDSLSSAGDIVVEKDAVLSFEDTDDHTFHLFSNFVSGEGKVVKEGSHTLQISSSGGLEHDGGIEIRGGDGSRLLGDTDTISGNISVGGAARLELSQGADGVYAEDISGEGMLVKSGTELLELSGQNSFSGGLFIESGDLQGNHLSIPGNISLEDATTRIIFDQEAVDGEHSGLISGTGSLEKRGTGTLTLLGSSQHSGGTLITEGILRGDAESLIGQIEVEAGASVEFASASAQRFSGTITGAGNFAKSGGGTLTLGSAQDYTGTTRVDTGTLRLEANLENTTSVRIAEGARLENGLSSLEIGGMLENHGQLAAGGENDTIHLVGDAEFNSTSTLVMTLGDQPRAGTNPQLHQASRIEADGSVFINEMDVELTILPGLYPLASEGAFEYVLLTAAQICPPAPAACEASGVSIGTVTSDSAFLDVGSAEIENGSGGGQLLTLSIAKNTNSTASFANTPNQAATAAAFDDLLASGSADSEVIESSWSVLSPEQVRQSLDEIAGESLTAFANIRQANAQTFMRALSRRFRANEYESGPIDERATRRDSSPELDSDPRSGRGERGSWFESFGIFGSQDGGPNPSRIQGRSYGVSGGIDARWPRSWPGSEQIRVGMGLGYTRHSPQGDHGMRGEANSFQTALYGSWQHGGAHLGWAGRYAYSELETTRRITFGALDRRARGDTSGHEAGGMVEILFRLGDPKRLALRPLARFEYNYMTRGEIVESGAGDLSLTAEGANFSMLTADLGLSLSTLYTLGGEFGLEAEIRGGWRREFGDLERPIRARFHAVPGAVAFTTRGVAADANDFHVGTGYVMSVSKVPLVGLNYDVFIGDTVTRHVLSAQLYLRW